MGSDRFVIDDPDALGGLIIILSSLLLIGICDPIAMKLVRMYVLIITLWLITGMILDRRRATDGDKNDKP